MKEIDKVEQNLKINFIKELMKLPVDKKTNTIRVDDVKKIIKALAIQLECKNPNIMETFEIMQDKKIMKRFEQKDSGKNISFKEMKKRIMRLKNDTQRRFNKYH